MLPDDLIVDWATPDCTLGACGLTSGPALISMALTYCRRP